MRKFGELYGVTASSLLLLGRQASDFLKACNKSVDELGLSSMSSELSYLKTVKFHIEDILKSKPDFRINSDSDPEEVIKSLLSALSIIIKNRTGIAFSSDTTHFFSDDPFGNVFGDDNDSIEDSFDVFGDSEGLNSEMLLDNETLSGNLTMLNLIEFTNSNEFIKDSLLVSQIDLNNLIDELTLFRDNYTMFEARCRGDVESPINKSNGIQRIVSAGRGNPEVIDFIVKSETRISLFHLSFKELDSLVSEMTSKKLFKDNANSVELDLTMYSDKAVLLGDHIAYAIYNTLNSEEIINGLIALCDLKSKSSDSSKILGIPLSLCYLKFNSFSIKPFCESLESSLNVIPNRNNETLQLAIKGIRDSIKIILDYIDGITLNRNIDADYSNFKTFVEHYILGKPLDDILNKEFLSFLNELHKRKLIPTVKEFSENGNLNENISEYIDTIYDTFKLYKMSKFFSLDDITNVIERDVVEQYGGIDFEMLLEVNKYLRDVYKIIPLTISNLVRNKVLAVSKTNKVTDTTLYNNVKPLVSLVYENYISKYEMSKEPYPGTLVIS